MTLIHQDNLLKGQCRACGKLSELINTHKVAKYMKNHLPKEMSEIKTKHPEESKSDSKGKKKKDKKKKDKKKKDKKKDADALGPDSPQLVAKIEEVTKIVADKQAGDEPSADELAQVFKDASTEISGQTDALLHMAVLTLFDSDILKTWTSVKDVLKLLVTSEDE